MFNNFLYQTRLLVPSLVPFSCLVSLLLSLFCPFWCLLVLFNLKFTEKTKCDKHGLSTEGAKAEGINKVNIMTSISYLSLPNSINVSDLINMSFLCSTPIYAIKVQHPSLMILLVYIQSPAAQYWKWRAANIASSATKHKVD